MTETAISPATLVLVEDDEQVRGYIRTILASENVRVIEAATGLAGLRVAREAGGPVDILLTDMLLPGLSGYDLARQLRDEFPDMRIIMMTGYVEGEIVLSGITELNATFLDKPFAPADLRKLISAAVNSVHAARNRQPAASDGKTGPE